MVDAIVSDPIGSASNPAARSPVTEGLPDMVQWTEGMLLSPQHLQQNDLYWQEQVRFRLQQTLRDSWGLIALELDPVKFKAGVVSVRRLECVLPDGTPVTFPGSYTGALEVDVTKSVPQAPSSLRISLVLPARSAAATRRDASLRRYDPVPGAMAIDENTGIGQVPVDRLRPRISLWAGGTIPAQYVACPLFEMARRTDSQAIEFRPYQPPLLRWGGGDFLQKTGLSWRLRNLNDVLWGKLRELAGTRGDDDGPDDDALCGMDARRHVEMARSLAAVLPQFGLLVNRTEAPPVAVYDALAAVVGAMASFGSNPVPPVLDAYQHDNCEPQFRRALDYVVRKLRFINTSYELLAFQQTAPHRFERVLPADGGELVIELRAPDGRAMGQLDQAALATWLAEACIAGQDQLADAQRARMSARPRLLTAEDVARRNLRPGGALFVIENDYLRDGGQQPLFAPGRPLVIEGWRDGKGLQPASILLYQQRKPTMQDRTVGHAVA